MRKIVTITLFCLLVFNLDAQQTYQYRYQIFDNYLLNPAYVGSQNYYPVLVGRDQRFYGLNDATPQTYFISAHSKVGEGYILKKDGKINEFFKKFGNIALGFQFTQYQFGPESETNIGFTYGYHLDLKQNYIRKNPRRLILALTPRLQGMSVRPSKLHLIGTALGENDDYQFYDSSLGENNIYGSWFFTGDVGALYQSVHADVGVAALNFFQTRNKLESEYLYLPTDTIKTYESLYPAKFLINSKLKFIDIYTSEKFDVYFIPSLAMLYAPKRNYSEFIVDLMFESTFKKHIAGIRKEIVFMAQAGLNINHRREYTPLTLLQPYVSFDFKNYEITYTHSIYIDNDLIRSRAAIGGSQISILFKIDKNRIVH